MQDEQFMDNPKREVCRMKELTVENVVKALEQETGMTPTLIHNPNDTVCAHSIIVKLNTCRQRVSAVDVLVSQFKHLFPHGRIQRDKSDDWIVLDMERCFVHFIGEEREREIGLEEFLRNGKKGEMKLGEDGEEVIHELSKTHGRGDMGKVAFLERIARSAE